MRRLLRWSLRCSLLLACLLLLCGSTAQAQGRTGYCIRWDQQVTPTRIIWSSHIRAGQTIHLTLPTPSNPDSTLYVAVGWGLEGWDNEMYGCRWRVLADATTLTAPAEGAVLWEYQVIEVEERRVVVGQPQTRVDTREIVVPVSVQRAMSDVLSNALVYTWLIAVPLGGYLGYRMVRAIVIAVGGWAAWSGERPEDGDREWEAYNRERGLVYEEDAGEYVREDRR